VLGLVNKPGRFEFPIAEEVRVTDAIALAGGINSIAADKIYVIRRKPSVPGEPPRDPQNPDQVQQVIIQVSLANAKQISEENIRLAPGDVVSIEQTPLTFIMDRIQRTGFNFAATVPLLSLF
jgi:polysaccharide export outer membrane protein